MEEVRRSIAAGRLEQARQELQLLPALLRESADGFLVEAELEHAAGDWRRSLELTQASLERDPDSAEAYLLFGLNVSKLGRPELAAEHLEAAAKLAPSDARPWYYLGINRLEQKRSEDARVALLRTLELRPDWVEARCALGLAHEQLGDFDAAKGLYREAAGKPGGETIAMPHLYLGRVLLAEERFSDAAEALAAAVRAEPGHAEAWAEYGRALVDASRHEEALSALDRAMSLAPAAAGPHYQRMRALKALGRTAEARVAAADFERLRRTR